MAYLHRLTLLMPINRVNSFNAWYKANISPSDADDAVAAPLNSSGDLSPPTHYWCSVALDENKGEKLVDRLVSQAMINKPANWNSLSRQEKKDWLNSQRASVTSRIGIRFLYTNNDDKIWNRLDDLLDEAGLRPRGSMVNTNG